MIDLKLCALFFTYIVNEKHALLYRHEKSQIFCYIFHLHCNRYQLRFGSYFAYIEFWSCHCYTFQLHEKTDIIYWRHTRNARRFMQHIELKITKFENYFYCSAYTVDSGRLSFDCVANKKLYVHICFCLFSYRPTRKCETAPFRLLYRAQLIFIVLFCFP